MPILKVDGTTKIVQSLAISRYLAKQFGLQGNGNLDQAKVDAIVDSVLDYVAMFHGHPYAIYLIHAYNAEEKQKLVDRQNLLGDKNLATIDKLISMYSTATGFCVGNALTWCDLYLFDLLTYVLQLNPKAIDNYPHVSAVKKQVEAHPKIAAYLKTRPEPVNLFADPNVKKPWMK